MSSFLSFGTLPGHRLDYGLWIMDYGPTEKECEIIMIIFNSVCPKTALLQLGRKRKSKYIIIRGGGVVGSFLPP